MLSQLRRTASVVMVGLAPCHPKPPYPTSSLEGKPCLEDQEPCLQGTAGQNLLPFPPHTAMPPATAPITLQLFPMAVSVS